MNTASTCGLTAAAKNTLRVKPWTAMLHIHTDNKQRMLKNNKTQWEPQGLVWSMLGQQKCISDPEYHL